MDKIWTKSDGLDRAGLEQAFGQQRDIRGPGVGEVRASDLEHSTARQERHRRRILRVFSLYQHPALSQPRIEAYSIDGADFRES